MVKKFKFGRVLETEAVTGKPEWMEMSAKQVPYFQLEENQELVFHYQMDKETMIYGLGEQIRGIDKRGWLYESNCSDDPQHQEGKHSLYGAHNFFMISGKDTFGVFLDTPERVTFDFGYSDKNEITVKAPEDLDFYLIEAESMEKIVTEFREMIGQSYIAPKWALGYGQSRWSYFNADEVREVVKEHRENHIPLDSVYLDIDYMERYKDFTVDGKTFPEFEKFTEEMRKQKIHLVPIIDAGVKIEEGYEVYEEGVRNGYFCKDQEGKDFVAGVWPGRVHFPDMLCPQVRDWFGKKYKFLTDMGIEGFWNDMNEPAIFYSEEGLKEAIQFVNEVSKENIGLQEFFELKEKINGLANNPKDYSSFYHQYQGETVVHDKVHNLYGYYMTRAAAEALEQMEPDKRFLLFSRSSYIGMHRYGGIWTGDNMSWWSHLLLNIKMMPSLNMCGFLYTGADTGGFSGDTTEDLLLRWLEFSIFTPLLRNHAALATRNQEAYRFTDQKTFAKIIGMRYVLLPYIYSEYVKAALENKMYFRPLSFVYGEDRRAKKIEDQLLVGESLMIAPVYEQNAQGRYVYLPERMMMVKYKSREEYTTELLEKGDHYIEIALEEFAIFIRKNHLLVLSTGAECVEELEENKLAVLGYVESSAEYVLYQDDGFSKDYWKKDHYITITAEKETDGSFTVKQNRSLEIVKTECLS